MLGIRKVPADIQEDFEAINSQFTILDIYVQLLSVICVTGSNTFLISSYT